MDKDVFATCDTIFLLFFGLGNFFFGKKGDEMDLRIYLGLGIFFTAAPSFIFPFLGLYEIN